MQLESGGAVCRHCGGRVGEDGYSDGGPVEESEGEAMLDGDTNDMPQQGVATERLRHGAGFADAVRNRRK